MEQIEARVISAEEAMPGVFLLWLDCQVIAMTAKPGQFVMVKCGDDNLLRRPLGVHRVSDDRKSFALLFARVGKGTGWLSQSKPGDRLDILGPLGNGFSISPDTRNILLIGGGIGVAPHCRFWRRPRLRRAAVLPCCWVRQPPANSAPRASSLKE